MSSNGRKVSQMKSLGSPFVVILSLLSSTSAAFAQLGSAESIGLSRLKADQPIYNTNTIPNLDNWEPNISVLGNSVFLIEVNTLAEDSPDPRQRYGVAFQPTAGGRGVEGEAFYT